MSIKVTSYVWEHSEHSSNKLLMLLAIADFADDDGIAYPGVPRLAKKSRVDERAARRTIKALIESGDLVVEQGKGIRTTHGNTNRYHLVRYQESLGGVKTTPQKADGGVNLPPQGGVVQPPESSVEPSDKKKKIQSPPAGEAPQPTIDKAAVIATQKALHFGVYPRAIKPCKMLMGTIEPVDSQKRNNGDWYDYRFEDKPFTIQEITALGLWLDSELDDVNLTRAETIADWAGRFRESDDYKLYMMRAVYQSDPVQTPEPAQDNVPASVTNPATQEYVRQKLAELTRSKHA